MLSQRLAPSSAPSSLRVAPPARSLSAAAESVRSASSRVAAPVRVPSGVRPCTKAWFSALGTELTRNPASVARVREVVAAFASALPPTTNRASALAALASAGMRSLARSSALHAPSSLRLRLVRAVLDEFRQQQDAAGLPRTTPTELLDAYVDSLGRLGAPEDAVRALQQWFRQEADAQAPPPLVALARSLRTILAPRRLPIGFATASLTADGGVSGGSARVIVDASPISDSAAVTLASDLVLLALRRARHVRPVLDGPTALASPALFEALLDVLVARGVPRPGSEGWRGLAALEQWGVEEARRLSASASAAGGALGPRSLRGGGVGPLRATTARASSSTASPTSAAAASSSSPKSPPTASLSAPPSTETLPFWPSMGFELSDAADRFRAAAQGWRALAASPVSATSRHPAVSHSAAAVSTSPATSSASPSAVATTRLEAEAVWGDRWDTLDAGPAVEGVARAARGVGTSALDAPWAALTSASDLGAGVEFARRADGRVRRLGDGGEWSQQRRGFPTAWEVRGGVFPNLPPPNVDATATASTTTRTVLDDASVEQLALATNATLVGQAERSEKRARSASAAEWSSLDSDQPASASRGALSPSARRRSRSQSQSQGGAQAGVGDERNGAHAAQGQSSSTVTARVGMFTALKRLERAAWVASPEPASAEALPATSGAGVHAAHPMRALHGVRDAFRRRNRIPWALAAAAAPRASGSADSSASTPDTAHRGLFQGPAQRRDPVEVSRDAVAARALSYADLVPALRRRGGVHRHLLRRTASAGRAGPDAGVEVSGMASLSDSAAYLDRALEAVSSAGQTTPPLRNDPRVPSSSSGPPPTSTSTASSPSSASITDSPTVAWLFDDLLRANVDAALAPSLPSSASLAESPSTTTTTTTATTTTLSPARAVTQQALRESRWVAQAFSLGPQQFNPAFDLPGLSVSASVGPPHADTRTVSSTPAFSSSASSSPSSSLRFEAAGSASAGVPCSAGLQAFALVWRTAAEAAFPSDAGRVAAGRLLLRGFDLAMSAEEVAWVRRIGRHYRVARSSLDGPVLVNAALMASVRRGDVQAAYAILEDAEDSLRSRGGASDLKHGAAASRQVDALVASWVSRLAHTLAREGAPVAASHALAHLEARGCPLSLQDAALQARLQSWVVHDTPDAYARFLRERFHPDGSQAPGVARSTPLGQRDPVLSTATAPLPVSVRQVLGSKTDGKEIAVESAEADLRAWLASVDQANSSSWSERPRRRWYGEPDVGVAGPVEAEEAFAIDAMQGTPSPVARYSTYTHSWDVLFGDVVDPRAAGPSARSAEGDEEEAEDSTPALRSPSSSASSQSMPSIASKTTSSSTFSSPKPSQPASPLPPSQLRRAMERTLIARIAADGLAGHGDSLYAWASREFTDGPGVPRRVARAVVRALSVAGRPDLAVEFFKSHTSVPSSDTVTRSPIFSEGSLFAILGAMESIEQLPLLTDALQAVALDGVRIPPTHLGAALLDLAKRLARTNPPVPPALARVTAPADPTAHLAALAQFSMWVDPAVRAATRAEVAAGVADGGAAADGTDQLDTSAAPTTSESTATSEPRGGVVLAELLSTLAVPNSAGSATQPATPNASTPAAVTATPAEALTEAARFAEALSTSLVKTLVDLVDPGVEDSSASSHLLPAVVETLSQTLRHWPVSQRRHIAPPAHLGLGATASAPSSQVTSSRTPALPSKASVYFGLRSAATTSRAAQAEFLRDSWRLESGAVGALASAKQRFEWSGRLTPPLPGLALPIAAPTSTSTKPGDTRLAPLSSAATLHLSTPFGRPTLHSSGWFPLGPELFRSRVGYWVPDARTEQVAAAWARDLLPDHTSLQELLRRDQGFVRATDALERELRSQAQAHVTKAAEEARARAHPHSTRDGARKEGHGRKALSLRGLLDLASATLYKATLRAIPPKPSANPPRAEPLAAEQSRESVSAAKSASDPSSTLESWKETAPVGARSAASSTAAASDSVTQVTEAGAPTWTEALAATRTLRQRAHFAIAARLASIVAEHANPGTPSDADDGSNWDAALWSAVTTDAADGEGGTEDEGEWLRTATEKRPDLTRELLGAGERAGWDAATGRARTVRGWRSER